MHVCRSFLFGIERVLQVAGTWAPLFRERIAPTRKKPRSFVLSLALPLALCLGLTYLSPKAARAAGAEDLMQIELTPANVSSDVRARVEPIVIAATQSARRNGHPAASMVAQANPQAGDAAHGQALVQGQCAACHNLQQGGGPRIGPDLFGVTERNIAGASDFDYSAALKAHQGTRWSTATLDEFLKGPTVFAPGTRMALPGIASETDRRDIIAYLETLSTGGTTGQAR